MTSPRPTDVYAALDWSGAHRVQIQMRYADLDTLGHLNNAVYVQYFETSRVLSWQTLDIPPTFDYSVIARQEIDYLREVRWGQEVYVDTMLERIGNTSWVTLCRLMADGQPCAYARAVQVRVSRGELRPQPLEPELRAALSRLMPPAEQP